MKLAKNNQYYMIFEKSVLFREIRPDLAVDQLHGTKVDSLSIQETRSPGFTETPV